VEDENDKQIRFHNKFEWMIFDEDLKLAGSIDMVYENPDGTLSIYDWKRSKDISKINKTLSYNPRVSLEDGLTRFLSWSQKNYSQELL
jgi:nucleoside-diphosphate-sugar epimerase